MNKDVIRSLVLSDIVYNEDKYKIIDGNEVKYLGFFILCNRWKESYNNIYDKNNKIYPINNSFIAFSKIDEILYISIAGTLYNKQFLDYLNGFLSEVTELNDYCNGKYYFHTKFLEYFRNIKERLFEIIQQNNSKRIIISGHSVGGSVAILGALLSKLKYPSKEIIYYSFGSPSGCCNNLKLLVNNTLDICISYHTKRDFIPKLTPEWLFKYPGKVIILDDKELTKYKKVNEYYFYHRTKNYYYLLSK